MSAAPNAPYERPPTGAPGQDRRPRTERDDRIETGIATGTRVASTDITINAGWFVKVPHGLFNVLCQAHALSGTHYSYLLMLYEHSHGFQSEYAITSLRDRRPPTMAHWSAWLGDISAKQVYKIRRELHQRHLIFFLNDDHDYVAFNMKWETWDQAVFARQANRRPPRTAATTPPAADDAETEALFFGDAPVTCRSLSDEHEELADYQSVTCRLPANGNDPSPEAASDGSPNNVIRDTKEDTDASASDAAGASSTPTLSPDFVVSKGHEPRQRRKRPLSQKNATSELPGSHPPTSARPPLSHASLPERLNGETTRAYWLRLYHEVAGNVGNEQHLAHRCAHAELGFTLTAEGTLPVEDCVLLGQLQHVAGNWGTVMHWLIECSSRAVAEPRGYLRGIARRQSETSDQEKPGKPRKDQRRWEFPTAGESTPQEDEAKEVPAAAEEGDATYGEQKWERPLMDEYTQVRTQIRLVYDWNGSVGKTLRLTNEQFADFITTAATMLFEQHVPLFSCRLKALRAASLAKEFYPHDFNQKQVERILEALRERW